MSALKEKAVLAKTRAASLEGVKTLNCWGSNLQDVSLLKRMPNLEVVSLSVNKIATLRYLRYCPNLRELYLRKNAISDIAEFGYLKHLPQLTVAWLSDNPAAKLPHYRLTVLRCAPSLLKLDNIDVTPDERRDATKVGLDLPSDPHENENDEAQETSQAEGNRSADKSVELASLQEELAQQRQRTLDAVLTLLPSLDDDGLAAVQEAITGLVR